MSPPLLTQLNSGLTKLGLNSSAIDRNFSPVLNYIDEFDRHFSHRHRFVNCFIPRFDLEEDAHSYYLYGDLPGARVEDLGIEVRDEYTLVIDGHTTQHAPHDLLGDGENPPETAPERRLLMSERLGGDFHRIFAFPAPVSEDGVGARMEDGVLCIVVPKRERVEVKRGRKVPIMRRGGNVRGMERRSAEENGDGMVKGGEGSDGVV